METGATNSNSALKSLATISSNGELELQDGAALTTTGALTNSNQLRVDDGGTGGSTLTVGGALTNSGYMQYGNYYMTAASTTKVNGALTNTGTVLVDAGNTVRGQRAAECDRRGARHADRHLPGVLICGIGGAGVRLEARLPASATAPDSAGYVSLSGSLAYMEVGATNSNSALRLCPPSRAMANCKCRTARP